MFSTTPHNIFADDRSHRDWLVNDDNLSDNEDDDYGRGATHPNLDLLKAEITNHVSNRMPIRLLQYSESSISESVDLVERIQVLELIANKMRAVTEEDVLHQITKQQKEDLKRTIVDLRTKLAASGSPFSKEGRELQKKIEEAQADMNEMERGNELPLGWYGKQALNNGRKSAFAEYLERYAGYAILSHTWNEKEVMYDHRLDAQLWARIQVANGKGYHKLIKFCRTAAMKHGISFFWMDTICIDKKNTSELSESIRSMYRWYSESSLCITYLAHTTSFEDLSADPWFKRGWTLQELLAPKRVKFYKQNWEPLTTYDNDKSSEAESGCSILTKISEPTGISPDALLFFEPGIKGGVASKMVWAASRKTTRGEDRAYSLMGVFAVSISIAYGEGAERAFFRLIEAILTCFSNALDVLNCGGKPISNAIHSSRVLPSGPKCYLNHDPDLKLFHIIPAKPLILTHIGLKVSLLCVEANIMAPGWGETKWGMFDGGVKFGCKLLPSGSSSTLWLRGKYPVLPDPLTSNKFVLGIWNFTQYDDTISLPSKCAAFLLQVNRFRHPSDDHSPFPLIKALSSNHIGSHSKVNTKVPITFSIGPGRVISYKPDELLESYGMKFLTIYL